MTTRSPELLGDKADIRKTFARHIVATIMSDHPGRSIGDLSILELGSGAGRLAGLLIDLEVCVYVRGCACVCACVQGAG